MPSTSTPYPSAAEIEEIFHYRTLPRHSDKFEQYVCDNADVHVFGRDFKLGNRSRGKKAFREFNDKMHSMADVEGDDKIEVVRVIGGGDQAWAAVNTRCVPSNEDGKGFYSENVYLVRFDLEGKIAEVKIFMDTSHTHAHLGDE